MMRLDALNPGLQAATTITAIVGLLSLLAFQRQRSALLGLKRKVVEFNKDESEHVLALAVESQKHATYLLGIATEMGLTFVSRSKDCGDPTTQTIYLTKQSSAGSSKQQVPSFLNIVKQTAMHASQSSDFDGKFQNIVSHESPDLNSETASKDDKPTYEAELTAPKKLPLKSCFSVCELPSTGTCSEPISNSNPLPVVFEGHPGPNHDKKKTDVGTFCDREHDRLIDKCDTARLPRKVKRNSAPALQAQKLQEQILSNSQCSIRENANCEMDQTVRNLMRTQSVSAISDPTSVTQQNTDKAGTQAEWVQLIDPLQRRTFYRNVKSGREAFVLGETVRAKLGWKRIKWNIKALKLKKRPRVGVVLFPEFEMLDAFGPLEMFSAVHHVKPNSNPLELVTIGVNRANGGISDEARAAAGLPEEGQGPVVKASIGPWVLTDYSMENCPHLDVLIVPGGLGTRNELNNEELINFLRDKGKKADLVMSVCTGSVLLAHTGMLDGHRATTNKRAFRWVASTRPAVTWVKKARWVHSGKLISSSGVSAGMDCALHVIGLIFGIDTSRAVANLTEYVWSEDAANDPFSIG